MKKEGKVQKQKQIESKVLQPNQRLKSLLTHQAITYGYMATVAIDLIKMGSFAPCVDTGRRDEAGNAVYRIQTPEELVARAVAITETAFSAFEERDWSCKHPPLEEMIEESGAVGFGSKS